MVVRAEKLIASPAHQKLGADHDRLLFNFLRISPSYGLVCQSGGQKITRATPVSSRRVLETFRKYGDVYRLPFDEWAGSALRGSGKTTPHEQALLVSPGQTVRCPDDYQGVLVPSEVSTTQKLAMARQLIASLPAGLAKQVGPAIRPKTLWRALAAVYERAKHPDIELWRIAILANLVERFVGKLDPWCKKKAAKDAEMRRHLTLMVVRAIFLALLVSENAAQGFFPLRDAIAGEQLEFPFAEQRLHALLSANGDTEYLAILEHAGPLIK